MQKGWGKRLLGLAPTLLLLSGLVWLSQPQNPLKVRDWWVLLTYEAPTEVVALSEQLTLSDKGEHIFYAAQPEISDASNFNEQCSSVIRETNKIFGCYVNNAKIYVFNVPNQELIAQVPVTAAHEFLHAVYARLGINEREFIDELISKQLNMLSGADKDILSSLELYEEGQDVRLDEAHSFLGTEAHELLPELEEYYGRYFEDRASVVALNDAYNAVFEQIEDEIASLERQLESLRSRIGTINAGLTPKLSEIQSLQSELNRLRDEGRNEEYNELVPVYNSKVRAYNSELNTLRSLTTRYNSLVEQFNNLALEQKELIDSTDSQIQAL